MVVLASPRCVEARQVRPDRPRVRVREGAESLAAQEARVNSARSVA